MNNFNNLRKKIEQIFWELKHKTASMQGRSQGEEGKFPPPETEKIVVENGVISEGSIFSNKFSKK